MRSAHTFFLLLAAALLAFCSAHGDIDARAPGTSHCHPQSHPPVTKCRVNGKHIACAKLCAKSQTWFSKHRKCVADYAGRCKCVVDGGNGTGGGGGGTTDEKTLNEQKVKEILSRRPASDAKEIVFDGATVIEENDVNSADSEAVGTPQLLDDLKFIQSVIGAPLPYQLSDIDVDTTAQKRTVVLKQAQRWKRGEVIRLAARKVIGNDVSVTSGGKTVTMRKSQYAANMLYLASADWNKAGAPIKYYWTTNLTRASTIQELSASTDAKCKVRQYTLSADKTQCVVTAACDQASGACCPPGGVVAYAEFPSGYPAPQGAQVQGSPVTPDPTYIHVCPLSFSNYLSKMRNDLTHELGHNMGLGHEFGPEGITNPPVAGDPTTARINGPTPKSIMSYEADTAIQATDVAGLDLFYNQTGQQNGYTVQVVKVRGT